ncbi:MAG: glutamate synthase-related protein [Armatimonadota bacterium]|nr:glutamate synthase-related protein [Armatimonadota bacterium]
MTVLASARYHIETRPAPLPYAPPARFRLAEQDEYVKYGHAPFETPAAVDPYWTPEIITQTWYMAERGKIPISGAGYGGPFAGPGFDGLWLDMSEIVRPTRDGIHGREYISTAVDLGRAPDPVPLEGPVDPSGFIELPVPMIFNPYPFPAPTRTPLRAVALAAQRLGTLAVVEPDQWGADLEPFLDVVGLRVPLDRLEALRALWSRMRYVELAPAAAAADWRQDVRRILDAVGHVTAAHPQAMVAVRLPLDAHAPQAAADLVAHGVAVIHLSADEYGQTPVGFVVDALRAVHGHLVAEALRDAVTLIVSGGIAAAEHVPKAIACGADLVALDVVVPVAFGCALWADRTRCHAEAGAFEPAWGAQRLVNLLAAWRDQLLECLGAMGMREVRRLRGEVGRVIFHAVEEAAFRALVPVHDAGGEAADGQPPLMGDLRWTPEVLQTTWTMAETGRPPARGAWVGRSGGGFDLVRFAFETDPDWRPPAAVDPDDVDLSLALNRRGDGPQIVLPLPVYGGGMSFGSVSLQTMLARAQAAAAIGTFTSTGEGGYPEDLLPWAPWIITQVATGLFGVREETIQLARIVELKYAQGAKPGLGGHLLGGKVTEAVAAMRESVAWVSLYSPFPFHSVYSVEDHKKHVDWIRTVNPRALVSVKVSTPTDVDMVAVGIYHAGAHIVHLDGGYGGTGAAPEIAKKNIAMPIEYAIPKVHQFLVQEGIRDEIVLVASGGIRTPYDAAKAIALGADGVVLGMAELVALGCTRLADCEKGRGCPFGITTTDPELSRLIDPAWGARRIANLYRAWMTVLRDVTSRLGLRAVRDLRGRTDLLRYLAGSREDGRSALTAAGGGAA